MAVPGSEYFAAFWTNILTDCLIIATSPSTHASFSVPRNSYLWLSSIIMDSSHTSLTMRLRSVFSMFRCCLPLSPLARNNSCSTSSFMCWDSFFSASMDSSRTCSSSLPHRSSIFTYPWITAIGVLSSWEASDTNLI